MSSRALLLGFAFSLLIGCASETNLHLKEFFPKSSNAKSSTAEKPVLAPRVDYQEFKVDPRLEKILRTPAVVMSEKNILASKTAIEVVNSQRVALISGNSNIGPRLSDDKNGDLEVAAGLTVNKVLDDGGAIDALEAAAELNFLISKSEYVQSINNQLIQVIRAEQALKNFSAVKKVFDEQIAIYNESRPLLDAAVNANVITKSEVLKLEQLKLRGEEQFLVAQTSADAAEIVRTKFFLKDTDKFFKIYDNRWYGSGERLEQVKTPRLTILAAQGDIIDQEVKGIQATFTPRVLMTGSGTAIADDLDNPVGFLGLNITLPIRDGGKRELEIKEKNLQKSAIEAQIEEAKLANLLAYKTLKNFNTLYEGRVNLLEAQIENSSKIVDDLELKLRAGAVSVAELATEKMTYFDLRNQRIALENQQMSEIFNFYETIEFACDLVNICAEIDALTQIDKNE